MLQDIDGKNASMDKESDLELMEVVARSLHTIFENFQFEVNTDLVGKNEQIISKSLEEYIKNVRDVFVESFNNLGIYLDKTESPSDSFDMFYFSAYVIDLFYIVYYSKYDDIGINLFRWHIKYGMRDSMSNIIKKLTELTDRYLDIKESDLSSKDINTKLEFEEIQQDLSKTLTRVLLLKEIELFNSSLWNIFPNNKHIVNLTNLLSQSSNEFCLNNTKLTEGLISLKDELPSVVQTAVEGLMGDGSVIQSCSSSWLEAFIFSLVYVPGIGLENFSQFISVYLDCMEYESHLCKIDKDNNKPKKRVIGSIISGRPQEMLEHELGAFHLLSKNMNEFVLHIHGSPHLYGPFLAAHLFDILFYEGFLENVPLEHKSKNLRSHVIMDYTKWLIETDLCDPAIYLQECIDLDGSLDDTLTILSLLTNKIPLLYEQISDDLSVDLESNMLSISDSLLKSDDTKSHSERCKNCVLSNLKFDWKSDESISVFIKFIREFIPQIIPDANYKLDFSRKLIIERYNQINIEFKVSLSHFEYNSSSDDSVSSSITLRSALLYFEKMILLLELSSLDYMSNSHLFGKHEISFKNNYMIWLALERFLNVPPCHFLKLNINNDSNDGSSRLHNDLFSLYKFQFDPPEEYNMSLVSSNTEENIDFSINISIDKQIKFLLEFFSQNGIIEEIIHLFPSLYDKDENISNIEFPPFLSTIIFFSRKIEPVFGFIYKPVWNSDTCIWESSIVYKTKHACNEACSFLESILCSRCLMEHYCYSANSGYIDDDAVNLVIEEAIGNLISVDPHSVPKIMVPLYCLYCLKLVDEYNIDNYKFKDENNDLLLNSTNNSDVIYCIYKNWFDIFFAYTVSDISHPFIGDLNLKKLLVSKIFDGVEKHQCQL